MVRAKGICISKLNCLAQCNGATTRLKYGDVTSVDAFREVGYGHASPPHQHINAAPALPPVAVGSYA